MLILKLAIRGLWRHKVRTSLTMAAVVFGQFLFLVFLTMNDGGHEQMIDIGIRQGRTGHVVVQAKGYKESQSVELLVTGAEGIRDKILKKRGDAKVAFRVFGGGLARTSADAVGVFFVGVEPKQERKVSDLPQKIVSGVYLGANPEEVVRAEKKVKSLWCALPPEKGSSIHVQPVVIGVQLAKTLKLGLCDKLVLDAQGMGSQESQQYRVVGIYKTGSVDLDGAFVQISLKDAQRILHLGKGVHQVAVFGNSTRQTPAIIGDVKNAVGKRPGLVVLPWDQVITEMAEFVWLDEVSAYVFILIVLIIIGTGVLNTVLMSVMERTREFGVMRAVGTPPGKIFWVVLVEGVFIGLMGVLIGTVLALPLVDYLETTGIDFTKWSDGSAMEMGGVAMTVIKGKLYAMRGFGASVTVFLIAVISSIYPAFRAVRMQILKAIHHV